jgi:hypothetical protein
MKTYLFCVKVGKLNAAEVKLREAAAEKHDVDFYYCHMPGEGWKSWFAGENMGEPFDRRLAVAVSQDIQRKGNR